MPTKTLHIGDYLRNLAEINRMSAPEIGEKISMTAQAVRDIFKKEQVHMKNIEDFSKLFEVNLYEVLAEGWQPSKKYTMDNPEETNMVSEKGSKYLSKKESVDSPISVTFTVDPKKKEALIKLLLD